MSRLVDFLRSAKEQQDRAALAALRRGLGKAPGEAPEMFPLVIPRLPPNVKPWSERCHYLTASLFALHPADWSGTGSGWRERNFGASVRRLQGGAEASTGPERRFVALLAAHDEDVGAHLQSLVGLLRAKDVPVDWEQLLTDLQRWERTDREVQRRWAQAYWAHEPEDEPAGDQPADPVAGD